MHEQTGQSGRANPSLSLGTLELKNPGHVRYNLGEAELYEEALLRKEAVLTAHGALRALTGQHTGRSAKDKFVVRDATTEGQIWWDSNQAMAPEHFDRLLADFTDHAEGLDLFVQDLIGGAEAAHALPCRVVTEYAWHSLFIRNLLIRPDRSELESFVPELTIIDLPSFRANPERHGCRSETVIAADLVRGIVLIGGTSYAGEMKKSVFTVLNYLLPEKGVMPMHCSANQGPDGDTAVFFGLSGTGKTTLSADPARTLIGDDEHGWSEEGVFNFEGGCYAKTIKLSEESEPEIYSTTRRFGTVLENVVLDANRMPDFDDGSLTENTRCAYPLHFIANASETGRAGQPANIVMLTADAFGVLPPIARLTPAQAMYHFLSGYTAKVAGTEKGVTEPEATFSTCFGAPFMPRHPSVYGNLLRELIARHGVDCWLVNTGWTGGAYGTGQRMPIKATRTLLSAALDGSLSHAEFRTDPNFGIQVPVSVPGIDSAILDPRSTWADGRDYDAQAKRLVDMFVANFAKFEAHVETDVLGAAPRILEAAEQTSIPLQQPGGRKSPTGLHRKAKKRQSARMASEPLHISESITIPGWELVEQFIRASGPGGQNVNKVASAVQLRFDVRSSPSLPQPVKDRLSRLAGRRLTKDGTLVIEADRYRTQERNRQDARERLKALIEKAAAPPPPKRVKTKPTRASKERRLKAKASRARIKRLRGSADDV